MSSPEGTLELIFELCANLTFRGNNERELQDFLADRLSSRFPEVTREAKLGPRDRVDFLVGRVAVEIKVDGSSMEVTRQLRRYLEHDQVDSLMLITTRRKHTTVPSELAGKPVKVIWVSPF